MNYKYFLLVIILLASCKGEFVVDETGESWVQAENISCTKCDFCHSCGLNFNGDMTCGFKHSCLCPGIKKVLVEITPYTGHYEKEPKKFINKQSRKVIKDMTSCR